MNQENQPLISHPTLHHSFQRNPTKQILHLWWRFQKHLKRVAVLLFCLMFPSPMSTPANKIYTFIEDVKKHSKLYSKITINIISLVCHIPLKLGNSFSHCISKLDSYMSKPVATGQLCLQVLTWLPLETQNHTLHQISLPLRRHRCVRRL